jgi:osmotically-inducible protein OsmY
MSRSPARSRRRSSATDVPKGQINVNAENGVVVLRGEVGKPELIHDLEEKTRKVQGVREVENLLSTPKTPAKKS